MKSLILAITLTLISFIAVGCNKNNSTGHSHNGEMGTHEHNEGETNHGHDSSTMDNHNESDEHHSNSVKSKITANSSVKFLAPYFVIQEKLVKDKLPNDTDIKNLKKSLSKEVKTKTELNTAIKIIDTMNKKDIKSFRNDFYNLSKVLIPMIKKYNLKGVQAYYCPMAKKTWIQSQSDITYNPYIPKQMLHCGSKI